MRLTHAVVKDFRSLIGRHEFDLSSGLNYFVGPNNAGKSNILRALELSLDLDATYDPARDRSIRDSQFGRDATTRIVLTFQFGSTGPDQTLKRYANAYERTLKGDPAYQRAEAWTFADEGKVKLITEFGTGGTRVTKFETKGKAALSLPADSAEHRQLERKFREVVRFAVVHSGMDLESLLRGKFRDVLNLVLSEHLKEQVAAADLARTTYLEALQVQLLEPLRAEVESRVGGLFREISSAQLVPTVPSVQETIASVEVQLQDVVTSSLGDKGTGVRGGVLLAMLQYLAAQSRRSLVLAVEEPEAFLHPGAQEGIRRELELLGAKPDVTLLVTTHSPHVVSRDSTTLVTQVSKDAAGATVLAPGVAGTERLGAMLGSLYADPDFLELMEAGLDLDPSVQIVVITEGYTDGFFIEAGCRAAGRDDLLEGIEFLPANKAARVVPAAILAKAATARPVIALLDCDDNGKAALNKLASIEGWDKNKNLLSLDRWPNRCKSGHDVEIEDLLPESAVNTLVNELGESVALDGKFRCGRSERFHLSLSSAWKEQAIERISDVLSASPDKPTEIVWLAAEIRRRAELLRSVPV